MRGRRTMAWERDREEEEEGNIERERDLPAI